jgi:hypothetical protein
VLRAAWLACALAIGCLGGQTGQESEGPVDCAIVKRPLAADAETALGFTAADVEALLGEQAESSLLWQRMQTRGELALQLLAVRDRYLNESTNDACSDAVGLDVQVSIRTVDGRLDETLEATVTAEVVDQVSVEAAVAMDAVMGTLTAEELQLDLRNWRDPVLSFQLERGAAGLRGEIYLDGSDPNPNDDRGPVSAAIASLPAP